MEHNFKISKDWYGDGNNIYKRASVTIKDGLTILCGCNGCGKTTLLHQIKAQLEQEQIPVLSFDNLSDGGSRLRQKKLWMGDTSFTATSLLSSEGENIVMGTGDFARKMGGFVRSHESAKEIFFLLDAIDSGLSIDNVIDLKRDLFSVVIDDCRNRGITAYIIVSANEYELARSEDQCLDTLNLKYRKFPTYEAFRRYIITTRKAKSRRYGQEWSEFDE